MPLPSCAAQIGAESQEASGAGADPEIPTDLLAHSYRWQRLPSGKMQLEFWAYSFDDWLERRGRDARTYLIDQKLVNYLPLSVQRINIAEEIDAEEIGYGED